jgi:hypothetical protein
MVRGAGRALMRSRRSRCRWPMSRRRNAGGSAAMAASSTARWSVAVLLPTEPGLAVYVICDNAGADRETQDTLTSPLAAVGGPSANGPCAGSSRSAYSLSAATSSLAWARPAFCLSAPGRVGVRPGQEFRRHSASRRNLASMPSLERQESVLGSWRPSFG